MRRLLGSAVALGVALLTPLFSIGCGGGTDGPQLVTQLRVLAVQLDPPDAVPGQEVQLSALIVDPLPGDSTLTWYACAVPITAGEYFTGGVDTSVGLCADPDRPFGDEIGTGSTASFTVPESFLDDAVDELIAQGWDDSSGELGLLVSFLGWHMRVNLVAERDDESVRIEAHKRLLVTGFGGSNSNPDPPAIHMQMLDDDSDPIRPEAQVEGPPAGECLVPSSTASSVADDTGYFVTPVNLPDPFETYQQLDSEGELQEVSETYYYSWFSTHPAVSKEITHSGLPELPLTTGPILAEELLTDDDGSEYLPLWVVVRDGRGGMSWCEQRLPYDGAASE